MEETKKFFRKTFTKPKTNIGQLENKFEKRKQTQITSKELKQ